MLKNDSVRIVLVDLPLKKGARVLDTLSEEAMQRDYPALAARYGNKMRVVTIPTRVVSINKINDEVEETSGPTLYAVIVSD